MSPIRRYGIGERPYQVGTFLRSCAFALCFILESGPGRNLVSHGSERGPEAHLFESLVRCRQLTLSARPSSASSCSNSASRSFTSLECCSGDRLTDVPEIDGVLRRELRWIDA
jgi:hypothetical protein